MPITDSLQPIVKEFITVEQLLNAPTLQIPIERMNGDVGLQNRIEDKNLHRPQLALAGYVELFTHHRVQIFGNTEIYYLLSLAPNKRVEAFQNIAQFPMPCIFLTNNHILEPEMLKIAAERNVPVFRTPYETTKVISLLSEYLDYQFSPQVVIHASFVDVYGVGVMFLGRSGIGKSEIALDLVERGHRLVADDIVMLTKKGEGILIGTGTSLVKHFMEIRGLGIIDVRQMFGVRAIRFQKRLEIIVELEEWDPKAEYTRTGLDLNNIEILDAPISYIRLPIFPGKNITVIAEVIALNYLLKTYGYDAAQEFAMKLEAEIMRKSQRLHHPAKDTGVPYFYNDIE